MTYPLVSVIIPTYNHERYIIECLESVVTQSYRPIEIIVVDDGSKDRTADFAENYLRYRAPSSTVVRTENSGAANAINRGVRLSTGKYINILNSDDIFSRDRISICVDFALRSGCEFIYTGVNFIDENSSKCLLDSYILSIVRAEHNVKEHPSIGFALMKNQLAISTGNFFFSRQIFNNLYGFNNYLYVHDWDFILRCLFFVEPVFLKTKLYNYRFHGENSFKSLENIAGYETSEVMRNFLWLVTSRPPLNGHAPCQFYWPGVFERFIKKWGYETYLPPRLRKEIIGRIV